MSWKYVLPAGVVLVAFAVINAIWIYSAEIPKTSLNVTVYILGRQDVKINDVPDPHYVASAIVRTITLLVIGLIGAKLIDTALTERRTEKREKAWQEYYQQYVYEQQQY